MIYALDGAVPCLPDSGRYWIAPNAVLVGKVNVAEGVTIWFGAVLRGDNEPISIGEGSNIQDNSVLHTDMGFPLVIGADCTIGHRAMLHGCVIGAGSLIGMGAIILNGAQIGKGCLIGAGALVPENKVIADGSVVLGSPGRVVRSVNDADKAQMKAGAVHYRGNIGRYRGGLAVNDEL